MLKKKLKRATPILIQKMKRKAQHKRSQQANHLKQKTIFSLMTKKRNSIKLLRRLEKQQPRLHTKLLMKEPIKSFARKFWNWMTKFNSEIERISWKKLKFYVILIIDASVNILERTLKKKLIIQSSQLIHFSMNILIFVLTMLLTNLTTRWRPKYVLKFMRWNSFISINWFIEIYKFHLLYEFDESIIVIDFMFWPFILNIQ